MLKSGLGLRVARPVSLILGAVSLLRAETRGDDATCITDNDENVSPLQ